MSDAGVLPPGAMVWLVSLGWCCLCVVALVAFLLVAWRRTRKSASAFARDRFVGYAAGAWTSGIIAGLSMSAINWSGSLGAFAHWIDRPAIGASWLAATIASAPIAGFVWNRGRREEVATRSRGA